MESDEKKTIDDTSTLSNLKFLFNKLDSLSTLAIENNLISQEDTIRLKVALNEIMIYKEELRIGNKFCSLTICSTDIFYLTKSIKFLKLILRIWLQEKEILSSRVWYTLGYGDDKYK